VASQIRLRDLGSPVSSPSGEGENNISSRQNLSLGSKYIIIAFAFFVYLEPVSGGCICRRIYVKRNLKLVVNVVVFECTVCYRVVAY